MNAMHAALASVTDSRNPGVVLKGDKGDGTPAGRVEAKDRWAWANDGHIPDIGRCGATPFIYEWKCLTPFIIGGALGHGCPSTVDGGRFAFGCTEESMRRKVYGLAAIGSPGERAFDRRIGQGRVDACDGDYADALRKGHGVLLLVAETTGALSPNVIFALRSCARVASMPTGNDTTVYGTSRTSPQSFFSHHLAAISAAIAQAESHVLTTYAATRNLFLTLPK